MLLAEWGDVEVVLVLPVKEFPAAWAALLQLYILDSLALCCVEVLGAVCFPSSSGFSPNLLPLAFSLTAFRC